MVRGKQREVPAGWMPSPWALTGDRAVLLTAGRGRRTASLLPDGPEQELGEMGTLRLDPAHRGAGWAGEGPSAITHPWRDAYLVLLQDASVGMGCPHGAHLCKFITEVGWDLREGPRGAEALTAPQLHASSVLGPGRRQEAGACCLGEGHTGNLCPPLNKGYDSEVPAGPSRILFRRQLCRKMHQLWQGEVELRECSPEGRFSRRRLSILPGGEMGRGHLRVPTPPSVKASGHPPHLPWAAGERGLDKMGTCLSPPPGSSVCPQGLPATCSLPALRGAGCPPWPGEPLPRPDRERLV